VLTTETQTECILLWKPKLQPAANYDKNKTSLQPSFYETPVSLKQIHLENKSLTPAIPTKTYTDSLETTTNMSVPQNLWNWHVRNSSITIIMVFFSNEPGLTWTISASFLHLSPERNFGNIWDTIFTGKMPFMSSKQQCQSNKGKLWENHPPASSSSLDSWGNGCCPLHASSSLPVPSCRGKTWDVQQNSRIHTQHVSTDLRQCWRAADAAHDGDDETWDQMYGGDRCVHFYALQCQAMSTEHVRHNASRFSK